ncbi:hypothetical protein SK128_023271 [Halocaridina rubra]|uniref:Uncharacterized protein n=1 Tax=Halocaridina rubra TaxID=373956 RepID=A0AAN8WQJ7_HALRR
MKIFAVFTWALLTIVVTPIQGGLLSSLTNIFRPNPMIVSPVVVPQPLGGSFLGGGGFGSNVGNVFYDDYSYGNIRRHHQDDYYFG